MTQPSSEGRKNMNRTLTSAILIILPLPFIAGQGCPPAAPSAQSAALRQGIPAGNYEGEFACESTISVISMDGQTETQDQSRSNIVSREFGPDGSELTSVGTALEIGDGKDIQAGPFNMSTTVVSIFVDDGVYSHNSEAEILLSGFDVPVVLSGGRTERYELQADGSVVYTAQMILISNVVEGEVTSWEEDCLGILQ
jgi:hypothetical protein